MRALAAPLLALVLVGASPPVLPAGESADSALARARDEAADAARRLAQLEQAAKRTGEEADRLRAEQAVAAAAIEDAEARITESAATLRLLEARITLAERQLAERRAPVAALLAALAQLDRRPPILAIADQRSAQELVQIRMLLDSTMPVIARRSAALQKELQRQRALAERAAGARAALHANRKLLDRRRHAFAALESRAEQQLSRLSDAAFAAKERVLAETESVALAEAESVRRRNAQTAAAELSRLELSPARPMRGDAALPPQDFAYSLPVSAPLTAGLGTVSRVGIRSRGLAFATRQGARVITPADGTIIFAAPYRSHDGVVIIDHGRGWTSLLIGVASDRPRGSPVRRGEPLGLTLGPIEVELRHQGRPVSPALIAASSVPLSNGGESR